jgi:hypothetical protein
MREIETQFKADLSAAGFRVVEGSDAEGMHHSAGRERAPSTGAEWRLVQERAVGRGEVRVGIGMRDVSLRTENVMGLYETRGGKALVIQVEIGG